MDRRSALRIRVATALLILQIAGGTLSAAGQSKKVILLTGQEGNYYHFVGRAIQAVMRGRELEIQLIATSGSQENINKLKHGDADFAIVQSDVAHDFWHNDPRFRTTNPKARCAEDLHATSAVSLVAPLFVEKVQILTGSHIYASSLADLNPSRLWLGVQGSGTRVTALEVLRAVLYFASIRSRGEAGLYRVYAQGIEEDPSAHRRVKRITPPAMTQTRGVRRLLQFSGANRSSCAPRCSSAS